jgi:hypothetical protein
LQLPITVFSNRQSDQDAAVKRHVDIPLAAFRSGCVSIVTEYSNSAGHESGVSVSPTTEGI